MGIIVLFGGGGQVGAHQAIAHEFLEEDDEAVQVTVKVRPPIVLRVCYGDCPVLSYAFATGSVPYGPTRLLRGIVPYCPTRLLWGSLLHIYLPGRSDWY